jgi:hypothetical protein
MTSVTHPTHAYDVTNLPAITLGAVKLGLLEAVVVLLFSLAMRALDGVAETAVCGLILAAGLAAVSFLPGVWTRARTIEGIAGAAGIGLGATFVFLLVDAALLQNIGTYTNRWIEIGHSNWWYHPVWWMVGTFLPWMGGWALANQTTRRGQASPALAFVTAVVCAAVVAALAVVLGFPGAHWTLPTFGIAFLPGVALAVAVAGLG